MSHRNWAWIAIRLLLAARLLTHDFAIAQEVTLDTLIPFPHVCLSPSGRWLVTSGPDRERSNPDCKRLLVIYDLSSKDPKGPRPKVAATLKPDTPNVDLFFSGGAFTADEKTFVIGLPQSFLGIDLPSCRKAFEVPLQRGRKEEEGNYLGGVSGPRVFGSRVLVLGRFVDLVDERQRTELRLLDYDIETVKHQVVWRASLDPGRPYVDVLAHDASNDGESRALLFKQPKDELRVYDKDFNGRYAIPLGRNSPFTQVQFSPHSDILHLNGFVAHEFVDARTGKHLSTLRPPNQGRHDGMFVAFSGNDLLITLVNWNYEEKSFKSRSLRGSREAIFRDGLSAATEFFASDYLPHFSKDRRTIVWQTVNARQLKIRQLPP